MTMWKSLLLVGALVAQPTLASAQDATTSQDRKDQSVVEFECPADLTGYPDLIQRRCRAPGVGGISPVDGLNSEIYRPGTKILIPYAALAATGIALATLKNDKPVSR